MLSHIYSQPYQGVGPLVHPLTDAGQSTLLLLALSVSLCMTGFHFDRARAYNIAFAVKVR